MDGCIPIFGDLKIGDVLRKKKPPINSVDVMKSAAAVLKDKPAAAKQYDQIAKDLPSLLANVGKISGTDNTKLEGYLKTIYAPTSFASLKSAVKMLAKDETGQIPGRDEGLKVALAMLENGEKTIYDPNGKYYQLVSGGSKIMAKDAVKDAASSDVAGAVVGGVLGSVTGPGAAAGALAVGVSASATSLVKGLVDGVIGTNDVPLFDGIKKSYGI